MKRISLLMVVLCCLLMTGCSGFGLTGRDILSPPSAQGERSQLMELIADEAGGAYVPVYPSSGAYQNAVIELDTDGDDSDETIVFCRGRSDETLILCFEKESGEYRITGKGSIPGAEIDKVDAADLDGDGTAEVILFYPDSASGLSSLTVIHAGETVVQADMPASFNTYIISDIDGDAARDILLLSLSSPVGPASATLLAYDHGFLGVKSACEMDSQMTGYGRITCGAVIEGVNGVFIDALTASGEYTTQVLYNDPARGGLFNPLFIYSGYDSTRRAERISSSDVDHDGLIEFPVCSLCDYNVKESPDTVCRRLTWNNYRPADMELLSKKTAILCEQEGFLFNISDNRVGSVTARYSAPDTVSLYRWEYKGSELRCTDLLLTIRRTEKDSADRAAAVLAETDDAVYTCEIGADGLFGYTEEEAQASFVLIDR